jgi:plastocyanin
MSTSAWIGIVIVIIVIALGGWFLLQQGSPSNSPVTVNTDVTDGTTNTTATTSSDVTATTSTSGGTTGGSSAPMTATVTYNGSSFSPSTVTIKKGGTVTFTNTSSQQMWVASGPHPAHTGYSGTTRTDHCPDTAGTAFDQCATGSTYSFTFQKVGEWPYHNHMNASQFGKVVVVE